MSTLSTLRGYGSTIGFILKLMDAMGIIVSGLLSYSAYTYLSRGDATLELAKPLLGALIIAAIALEASLTVLRAYQNWKSTAFGADLRAVLGGTSMAFMALLAVAFIIDLSNTLPRTWIILWYSSTLAILISSRILLRCYLRNDATHSQHSERILIVGNGELGQRVADTLLNNPVNGLMPVGFVSNRQQASLLETLGPIDQLPQLIKQHEIHQVWIALSLDEAHAMAQLQTALRTTAVTVRMIPDLQGFQLLNHSVSQLGEMPIINLTSSPMHDARNRLLKRLEDIILSSLILISISPIMLLIAMSIKFTSEGPVLYRQTRVSWNGKEFQMLKFRTMTKDNEQRSIEWGNASAKNITPIGRLLRCSSLDELPQFLNVLKGDMSIIGPRPERPIFVEQFKYEIPRYMHKHMVKAGISGWAQVNGWRGDTDLEKRIEHDIYYIEHWSIWLDIKIIALTLIKGFIHRHAR